MSFTKAETASLGSFRIGHILFVRLLPYVRLILDRDFLEEKVLESGLQMVKPVLP